MFGMRFFFNFEINIFYIFLEGIANKKIFFGPKMDPKKNNFVSNTLEESNVNKSFKIGQKRHTKHHKIDQILMFFDRFDDVWYAVFDQFRNLSLSYFPQGYGKQNKCLFGSILSQ